MSFFRVRNDLRNFSDQKRFQLVKTVGLSTHMNIFEEKVSKSCKKFFWNWVIKSVSFDLYCEIY